LIFDEVLKNKLAPFYGPWCTLYSYLAILK